MNSITHALASVQHVWVLIVGGGLILFVTVFWEPVMKILKSLAETMEAWHKAGTAKAQHRIAETGQPHALFEIQVADKIREIRKLKAEKAKPNIFVDIKPGPNENLEVFDEAMRRIKNEDRQGPTLRWRG